MSKHARHIKVRTFGGILSDQTFFHMYCSCASKECSPVGGLFSLSATWYAILTKKTWFLFSFHFKRSLEFKSHLLHRKMSFTIDWVNVAANKLRFHWLVSSLTRSRTFKHVFAPLGTVGVGVATCENWSQLISRLPPPISIPPLSPYEPEASFAKQRRGLFPTRHPWTCMKGSSELCILGKIVSGSLWAAAMLVWLASPS